MSYRITGFIQNIQHLYTDIFLYFIDSPRFIQQVSVRMHSLVNASNETDFSRTECFISDSKEIKIVRATVYSVIILASVLGNTGIIRIIWKEKRMRHSINFFIGNMSTTDLLMTIGYMPRMLTITFMGYEWAVDGWLGLIFCKTLSFLFDTCVCVSIFTAIAISLDRFLAVALPLRVIITNRNSKIIIITIWFTAALIQSPLLYSAQLVHVRGRTSCNSALDETFVAGFSKLYYITVSSIYVSSLCMTVVLYIMILIFLKVKRERLLLLGSKNSNTSARKSRQKSCRNVIHMVLTVIGFFVVSWTMFVLQLVLYSHNIILSNSCNVNFIVGLLAHSNCAVTPFLYVAFSENYRKGFKRLFYCGMRSEVENSSVSLALRTVHAASKGTEKTKRKLPGSSEKTVSLPSPAGSFPFQWIRRDHQDTLL